MVATTFVPRERRYVTQAGLAAAGLAVALGGSVYVYTELKELKPAGDVVARGKLAAEAMNFLVIGADTADPLDPGDRGGAARADSIIPWP